MEGGQRLAAEAWKSHPHWQKESGVLRTASVGDPALGPVTSQAWDPDPTGLAEHTPLQQEQLSTQGSLSPCPCLLIPLTWVAGNTRRGRNVPAKSLWFLCLHWLLNSVLLPASLSSPRALWSHRPTTH